MSQDQRAFDDKYISSLEICRTLNVTRSQLAYRRRRDNWPEPITIDGIRLSLWPRKKLTSVISKWRKEISRVN